MQLNDILYLNRYQLIPKILILYLIGDKMTSEQKNPDSRIESRQAVETYLARLKYALNNRSAKIQFQKSRRVDKNRDKRHTNIFTLADLFPEQNTEEILKRELKRLRIEEYIETVKDKTMPDRSEMRIFGKVYRKGEVYIKIRVELLKVTKFGVEDLVFIMSFHYSTKPFEKIEFPYS